MGSAVRHFSLNANRTVIIVRRKVIRKEKPNKGYEFLVLYDGSDEAKKGLIEILKIIDPVHDILDCVSFDSTGNMESHIGAVEKIFTDAKLAHATYKVLPLSYDTPK